MDEALDRSVFRIEKRRAEAILTLSDGRVLAGCFFLGDASGRHVGPERIGDVLNAKGTFFPFQLGDADGDHGHTTLLHRDHVVTVALPENEDVLDPAYAVARPHAVWLQLASGRRVHGSIRFNRPPGQDRLSDWADTADRFCYIETEEGALLVNVTFVVEIREVES
jgi:hypothetical protein